MLLENPLKVALNAGKVSVGSWLNLASPLAAEVLATERGDPSSWTRHPGRTAATVTFRRGDGRTFEWLTVDMEHGPWALDDAANGFRAIESRGAVPLARVWSHKPEDIARSVTMDRRSGPGARLGCAPLGGHS